MAQVFFITKGSTLPTLRMEAVNNGKYDFKKLITALQAASVTFSMTNTETGIKKIANAKAHIIEKEDGGCQEEYLIEYRWNKRDTNENGTFKGQFKITFDSNITVDGMSFPKGDLIVPIAEDLIIEVS